MSALPPVPALIPIALLKSPGECAPRGDTQRYSSAIDSAAATASPQPRKTRSERHRKSERRREPHRSRPKPIARVNPIFVWVRQEDTRIVDVKCEDYDKRNRILLTKTAHGWRAIPRTETLREAAERQHHRHRKSKGKSKVRRRSAAVQADKSPKWSSPVNVECHLPSHKIEKCVNSDGDSAPAQELCTREKVCEVSPLDNLLAVAEFEFNQQLQEEWKEHQEMDQEQKDFLNNMEQLIESCSKSDTKSDNKESKGEDCDYTEEDDNNIAMDDILSRLEQSLQSPECVKNESENVPERYFVEEEPKKDDSVQDIVESSTIDEEPTDLSTKNKFDDENNECNSEPTDLSIPKMAPTPRPLSQNSEAIQSPQPSGIPAVPPSPDIVSTTKSQFLESLLSQKSEAKPLDLGKCRKSPSPTVTCSEEVKSSAEPESKKFKTADISLKNLLDFEMAKKMEKAKSPETPRLLELLKTDSEPDPLTQLRQVLADSTLNVPDPMLVPKERLSQIISHPGREIPRLLKQRPELRLPEALAFPHLLQDPDILVITLQQLETIILKQSLNLKELKPHESPQKTLDSKKPDLSKKGFNNEFASDIDAATTAAFNQMIWLPYMNQLETMSFGNPEMMKMLNPSYHSSELHNVRFPPCPQPPVNYNSLEMSLWQEAMLQANMLRPKYLTEPKNSFRDYFPKSKLPTSTNFYPSAASYQNSYLSYPKPNLIPTYNPILNHHKSKTSYFSSKQTKSVFPGFHKSDEKHKQQKVSCKTFASVGGLKTGEKLDFSKQQPMDLSGSTAPKLKVKQHLIEPVNASKLLKHDDVSEVGSTTTEEMQDVHKQLWHPLFGNQKAYHSPWNWTTMTATGE